MKSQLSDKKRSLGDRIAAHYKKGDVVGWKGWKILSDGTVIKEVYQGVLIDLITETVGGRSVTYGRVLPFQNDIIVEVNIFCLYKVEQKD